MVKVLEKRVSESLIDSKKTPPNIKNVHLYEIDLGEKGYLTASDIIRIDPECQSDGCCYSGGGCYSNCDISGD